jgi:hypothetical protein
MRLPLITLLALASFQVITEEVPKKKYIKVVDNDLRKTYYVECKKLKLKNCHMEAFEKALVLKQI